MSTIDKQSLLDAVSAWWDERYPPTPPAVLDASFTIKNGNVLVAVVRLAKTAPMLIQIQKEGALAWQDITPGENSSKYGDENSPHYQERTLPDGRWLVRAVDHIGGTYQSHAVLVQSTSPAYDNNTTVRPTLVDPVIIAIKATDRTVVMEDAYFHVRASKGQTKLKGQVFQYDVPNGRDFVIEMAPNTSTPMPYPIYVRGGNTGLLLGIEAHAAVQPNCAIGESDCYNRTDLPNLNPRVPVGKMLIVENAGDTHLEYCLFDMMGTECDFLVPHGPSNRSSEEHKKYNNVSLSNCRIVGFISCDKVVVNGEVHDGIHADVIQNQKHPLGSVTLRQCSIRHQGNGITHHGFGQNMRFLKLHEVDWGRDLRYSGRRKSNGLAFVVNADPMAADIKDFYFLPTNNVTYAKYNGKNIGAVASSSVTKHAGMVSGTPPDGDYAPADKVGFNYK